MRGTFVFILVSVAGVPTAHAQDIDAAAIEAAKRKTPDRIVTTDAFSSVDNNQQTAPSLSAPLPDQLSANLQVQPNGAAVTAGVAPFGFARWYKPVISDLRLEAFGNAANQPEFGFGVSVGYDSASWHLKERNLDPKVANALLGECPGDAPAALESELDDISARTLEILDAVRGPQVDPAILANVAALASVPRASSNWNTNLEGAAAQLVPLIESIDGVRDVQPILFERATELKTELKLLSDPTLKASARDVIDQQLAVNVITTLELVRPLGALPIAASALDKFEAKAKTPKDDRNRAKLVVAVARALTNSSATAKIVAAHPALSPRLNELAAAAASALATRTAAADTISDCLEKKLAAKRVDEAFKNAGAIFAKGTFHFFPVGSGPTYKSSDGSVIQPFNNAVSLMSISVIGAYFPSRYVRLQPTAAFSWNGASPAATRLDRKFAAGLDLGWSAPFGSPDKDGFQPAFGLGVNWSIEKCVEAAGCARGDIANYSGPKPKVDLAFNNALYVFVRVSAKLQFQFSLPVKIYMLAQPIDSSSASTQIVEFIPTLSASVAGWSVAQATTGGGGS